MTSDEAIEGIGTLKKRLESMLETGFGPSWEVKWDILKNDIEEFAERSFDKKSKDMSIVQDALHLPVASLYGDSWTNFVKNYGEPALRALITVEHRLEQGQTQLLEERADEQLIKPGTPHSAYVFLRDIIEGASQRVLMVDPYVDRNIFPLLSNAKPAVEIQVLTRQKYLPKDFATEATKFIQETSLQLKVRCGLDDDHDRYLVVDDRLFHSGASFKDMGKKSSVVAEMKTIKAQVLAILQKEWDTSSPL